MKGEEPDGTKWEISDDLVRDPQVRAMLNMLGPNGLLVLTLAAFTLIGMVIGTVFWAVMTLASTHLPILLCWSLGIVGLYIWLHLAGYLHFTPKWPWSKR